MNFRKLPAESSRQKANGNDDDDRKDQSQFLHQKKIAEGKIDAATDDCRYGVNMLG